MCYLYMLYKWGNLSWQSSYIFIWLSDNWYCTQQDTLLVLHATLGTQCAGREYAWPHDAIKSVLVSIHLSWDPVYFHWQGFFRYFKNKSFIYLPYIWQISVKYLSGVFFSNFNLYWEDNGGPFKLTCVRNQESTIQIIIIWCEMSVGLNIEEVVCWQIFKYLFIC